MGNIAMTVKQIVLGVKNEQGELSRIVGRLNENDIRLAAFWVGTDEKKAILRFIASDLEAAKSVLIGMGFKAKVTDVIAAQVPDHPGGLKTILNLLDSAGIDIHHIYPCLQTQDPILILEVDKTQQAVRVLQDNWINLYDEKIYSL